MIFKKLIAHFQIVPFLKKNGKYIYVDFSTLNPVFKKGEYDDAEIFNEESAIVKIHGKSGFINKEGDIVIPRIVADLCIWFN